MSLLTDLLGNNDADWMDDPNRNCAIPEEFTPKEIGPVADAWFPTEKREEVYAKRLCHGCPVERQCFMYAFERPELEGVWGATSTNERVKLRAGKVAPNAA